VQTRDVGQVGSVDTPKEFLMGAAKRKQKDEGVPVNRRIIRITVLICYFFPCGKIADKTVRKGIEKFGQKPPNEKPTVLS